MLQVQRGARMGPAEQGKRCENMESRRGQAGGCIESKIVDIFRPH